MAAANLIAAPLRDGTLGERHLDAVQQRRMWPTRATQAMQLMVQNRIIRPTLQSDKPLRAPWLLRTLLKIPGMRTVPARLIGIGVRPEHVRSAPV